MHNFVIYLQFFPLKNDIFARRLLGLRGRVKQTHYANMHGILILHFNTAPQIFSTDNNNTVV